MHLFPQVAKLASPTQRTNVMSLLDGQFSMTSQKTSKLDDLMRKSTQISTTNKSAHNVLGLECVCV